MTTPISFLERAKLALKNATIAEKAVRTANTTAARNALIAAQFAGRCARWQPRFDAVLDTSVYNSDTSYRVKAAKLAIKIASFIDSGRSSGSTGGTKAPHTVICGAVVVSIEGVPIRASNTNMACQLVRVSRGLKPLVGSFSAPREAARLGVQFHVA